ncbi:hypothetical protein [Schnuerera sp.]|uniref:hypothetical protein n=1 Tax=Schnuerera sp. TaxID=2794844 RepID=UPI002B9713C9|nr:hypothetical protein [Schnuerera sp.]HSH35389.1 hypothetical protein [Schnuerera sp.]
MLRVTSRNRKPIKDLEKEVKEELDKKNKEKPFEFTKKDILAMIIAGYQVIMPIALIGVIVFAIFTYVFLNFFLK